MAPRRRRRWISGVQSKTDAPTHRTVRAIVLATEQRTASQTLLERTFDVLQPDHTVVVGTASGLPRVDAAGWVRSLELVEEPEHRGSGTQLLAALVSKPAPGPTDPIIVASGAVRIGRAAMLREALELAYLRVTRAPEHVLVVADGAQLLEHGCMVVGTQRGLLARYRDACPNTLRLFEHVASLDAGDGVHPWTLAYCGLREIDILRDILAPGLSVIRIDGGRGGSWQIHAARR
jgi:hypothetical protein